MNLPDLIPDLAICRHTLQYIEPDLYYPGSLLFTGNLQLWYWTRCDIDGPEIFPAAHAHHHRLPLLADHEILTTAVTQRLDVPWYNTHPLVSHRFNPARCLCDLPRLMHDHHLYNPGHGPPLRNPYSKIYRIPTGSPCRTGLPLVDPDYTPGIIATVRRSVPLVLSMMDTWEEERCISRDQENLSLSAGEGDIVDSHIPPSCPAPFDFSICRIQSHFFL